MKHFDTINSWTSVALSIRKIYIIQEGLSISGRKIWRMGVKSFSDEAQGVNFKYHRISKIYAIENILDESYSFKKV